MYRTFDEWKAKGFHVVKGEKSLKRDDKGKALFKSDQVAHNEDQWEDEYEDPMYMYDYFLDAGDR